MEETLKLVEHPIQQGRHSSTQRLLWWLAADLVLMLGILVWYFITIPRGNLPSVPSGITASADTAAIGTVEYGTKTPSR
jgi:hypothetical protein